MAQFPGLMLWTDAWVADTHHLSRDARGAYMDLLIKMWRTPGCRVPNNDLWLANNLPMPVEDVVQVLRPIVRDFCQTDGNWIFQKRLQREFLKADKIHHARSVAAKAREAQKKKSTRVAHPQPDKKIESYLGRATTVDNSGDNSHTAPTKPKQGATDKRPCDATRHDLETVFAARHSGNETWHEMWARPFNFDGLKDPPG